MGAVKIETYNYQLMIIADYDDEALIKKLLKNFHNLEALAQAGDSVACSIYVDLKTALNSPCLTVLQRDCVIAHLIEKEPLNQIAQDLAKDKSTIQGHVDKGIEKIKKALNSGTLYGCDNGDRRS